MSTVVSYGELAVTSGVKPKCSDQRLTFCASQFEKMLIGEQVRAYTGQ